jgi:Uma2 family endonuclease
MIKDRVQRRFVGFLEKRYEEGKMTTVDVKTSPLSGGDNLTREEFLRRRQLDNRIKKAELICGIVYLPSPVTIEHGVNDGYVGTWLGSYQAATPGTQAGHNTTSFLLKDAPQPDNFLRIFPEFGGASSTKDNYLAGSPELLAEICLSSTAYDLHQKFDLYQEAGVQEFLAIMLHEKEIRWYVLLDWKYQVLHPDADGILRSRVFPGLWLDGAAFFQGDMRRVLDLLQKGIDSPEHKDFVQNLADKASGAA